MRRRSCMVLALLSCCCLGFMQSCSSEQSLGGRGGTTAKDEQEPTKVAVDVGGEEAIEPVPPPVPVAPLPVVPAPIVAEVPPPPPPVIPWGGSDRPFSDDDGHEEEEEPKHHHKHKKCGDGKQEAFHRADHCKYDLFGTVVGTGGASILYGFNLKENGKGHLVGVIPGFTDVGPLDFSPKGVIYAIGKKDGTTLTLITIDCRTGKAHGVGTITGLSEGFTITDIDFDQKGSLFANSNNGLVDRVGLLVLVGPTAGAFVALPNPTGTTVEAGLGSIPFPVNNTLYDAGAQNLNSINKLTGVGTFAAALTFPASLTNSPRITGMDADFVKDIMYTAIKNGADSYLGTLSVNAPTAGRVSFLTADPPKAPVGLVDVAVKQSYEECDFKADVPPLPEGTKCTHECKLIEDNCVDGIDNDQNGLIDCADPACNERNCNDGNGCTLNDKCEDGVCRGTPVACIATEECLLGTCISTSTNPGNDHFFCEYSPDPSKLDYGSCTPDDNCDGPRNPDGTCPEDRIINLCEVGRCVQQTCPREGLPPETICEGKLKTELFIAICVNGANNGKPCSNSDDCPQGDCVPQGDCDPSTPGIQSCGCLDTNSCTADSCNDVNGHCDYEVLDGLQCYNTDTPACRTGQCIKGTCTNTSVFAPDGTACNDSNICTRDEVCIGGFCQGAQAVICNADDQCESGVCDLQNFRCRCGRLDDSCDTSRCEVFVPGGAGCFRVGTIKPDGTDCTRDTCIDGKCLNGVCSQNNVPNNNECSVDQSCEDNLCLIPQCQASGGCETQFADGPTPCTIAVPNQGICQGTVQCDNGEPNPAGCIPNQPFDCASMQ